MYVSESEYIKIEFWSTGHYYSFLASRRTMLSLQSEAEHATYRSRMPPYNIESLRVSGEETFCRKLKASVRLEPAISDFPSRQL